MKSKYRDNTTKEIISNTNIKYQNKDSTKHTKEKSNKNK